MSQGLDAQAKGCASTAMVTLMHFCGTAVIAAKGSEALKKEILPACAHGGHLTTLAFSKAGSGGHFYAPVGEVRVNGGRKRSTRPRVSSPVRGRIDSYGVSARKIGDVFVGKLV
jgi:isovaleryl-CoA dehydrogenase